ncbi:MAG: TatD family hydrolase [Clostridiales Family XIII bacterium]|jgi:TatD DNase family protein|nr:TatD family hydrolase [Clostridiales Family XIII bacterium]
MYFDSHTHINNEGYSDAARATLIRDIEASSVDYTVDVGFDLPSSRMAATHALFYPWCYAAVGVHPHNASELTQEVLDAMERLTAEEDVVAIGEIGLDYFRNLSPKNVQINAFQKQIALALKLKMPIVIHDRDSDGDVMRILEESGAFSEERKRQFPRNPETGKADARVLLHCFSGTAEDALDAIEHGCTISFSGTVTYKKNDKTQNAAMKTPFAHMLVETDAPYLAPEPYRGKKNTSPLIAYTVQKIAALRGVSEKELAEWTKQNALRFFGIHT